MNPSPTEFRAKKIEELLSSGNQPAGASSSSPRQSSPVGADCPAEEYWLKVSAHELDEAESLKLINHAAQCQSCGPRLHYWASILAEEESPEESLFLSQLPVSKSGWQERMAKGLMRSTGSSPPSLLTAMDQVPGAADPTVKWPLWTGTVSRAWLGLPVVGRNVRIARSGGGAVRTIGLPSRARFWTP